MAIEGQRWLRLCSELRTSWRGNFVSCAIGVSKSWTPLSSASRARKVPQENYDKCSLPLNPLKTKSNFDSPMVISESVWIFAACT